MVSGGCAPHGSDGSCQFLYFALQSLVPNRAIRVMPYLHVCFLLCTKQARLFCFSEKSDFRFFGGCRLLK